MTAGDSSAGDVEVPASPLVHDTPLSFPDVCARIHGRIAAFLAEQPASPRLESLQQQTRISLRVIEDALDKYRYARPRSHNSPRATSGFNGTA
jgi:FAD synthetase